MGSLAVYVQCVLFAFGGFHILSVPALITKDFLQLCPSLFSPCKHLSGNMFLEEVVWDIVSS